MNGERFHIYSYDKSGNEIDYVDVAENKDEAIDIADEPVEETVLIFDTRDRIAFIIGPYMEEVRNCKNTTSRDYSQNGEDYSSYEWRNVSIDDLGSEIED